MYTLATRKVYGLTFILLLSSLDGHSAIVAGQTIGVDFGTTAATNNFNSTNATGSFVMSSLIDTDGSTVSGVELSVAGIDFSNADPNIGAPSGAEPVVFNESNLLDFSGGFGSPVNTLTLNFTGLDDGLMYELDLVSAFDGRNLAVTVSAGGDSIIIDTTSVNPTARFAELTSSGGELLMTVQSSDAVVINALALTAASVPEPGSVSLLGLGSLLFLLKRRRN
ncbi:PEP-CTERM protein-sorting domain-containing protein [Rubritalea squalenifaciens DSM 18772]|uniref:PEP-CTERM protein-sorting domain-containing protein n=1 Tax=Rubritalea squalenifaciens DSM 18772 TaxID=1123071 RepID=A0A1M6NPX5_9BACT|nr:PEP-CTERM sorting domain-containing protein [Rubritalea squalenifaciens]SHJ97763.1 PEP-CTERM protein-sorting domain-containing protein [Rubritalea squalenifaciens DSM 18772]